MTNTLLKLLTQLSEAGDDAILPGATAEPFFGQAFEHLLKKRVIIEQAPLADWDVCRNCECGLSARPIQLMGDGYVAECPLDQRQDVHLSAVDLRVFRIDAQALASALAQAAGFEGPARLVAARVWRLGACPSGQVILLALAHAALTADGMAGAIRQAVRGANVTILVPDALDDAARRLGDAGFHVVETMTVLTPASNALGTLVDVSALEPQPLAPLLRVRTATAEVIWGTRSVILSHQLFPVFQCLLDKARSRHPVASSREIEGTTGREAKDLIRELRVAFKAAGLTDAEVKSLIKTVHGRGYQLGVPPSEILVEG